MADERDRPDLEADIFDEANQEEAADPQDETTTPESDESSSLSDVKSDETAAADSAEATDESLTEAVPEAEGDVEDAEAEAARKTEERLLQLFQSTVYGPEGQKLGRVGQVYLDDQTQDPNWVTVKTGFFGTKEFFVPLDLAEFEEKKITVPYTKEQVTSAPRTEIDQNLSPSEEDDLYVHYQVPDRQPEGSGDDLSAPDDEPKIVDAVADDATAVDTTEAADAAGDRAEPDAVEATDALKSSHDPVQMDVSMAEELADSASTDDAFAPPTDETPKDAE